MHFVLSLKCTERFSTVAVYTHRSIVLTRQNISKVETQHQQQIMVGMNATLNNKLTFTYVIQGERLGVCGQLVQIEYA